MPSDKVREILLNNICDQKFHPSEDKKLYMFNPERLDQDGRKRRGIVNELIEDGYMVKTGDDYFLTEKVWKEHGAEKPDLFAVWEKRMKRQFEEVPPLVGLFCLNFAAKKYLYENSYDYRFMYVSGIGGRIGVTFPFVPGKSGVYEWQRQEKGYMGHVHVTSDSLEAAVAKVVRDEKVAALLPLNLRTGLEIAGIVKKDAPRFFDVGQDGLLGSDRATFSNDPAKWAADLPVQINDTLTAMKTLQDQLAALVSMQQGIYNYGGWDKFIADLRQQIEASLDRKTPTKEASTEKEG